MEHFYNKLVRDNIPFIISNDGKSCDIEYIESDEMMEYYLLMKIIEEINELFKDKTIGEIADVLEVLLSIGKLYGFTEEEKLKERKIKKEKNGGFDNRIVLWKVYE